MKLHVRPTNIKNQTLANRLIVVRSHTIDNVRGRHYGSANSPPLEPLGACPISSTSVYFTDNLEIIKHFCKVFFDSDHLNSHLTDRKMSIKYYDSRGFEYVITERKSKTE